MIYTPGFSRKTMLIFKIFIEFFIDYGIKEFGENKFKLDWYRIYENLFIFNFYHNYDEWIILNKNEENSKEEIEKYTKELCNKIIKNGERIDLFFEIKNNDNNNFIDEINKRKNEIDNEKFNSKKCYKCKHFLDDVVFLDNNGIEISFNSIKREYENKTEEIRKRYYTIHKYDCDKRNKIINELMKSVSYPFDKEERINRKFEENNIPKHFYFKYDNGKIIKKWILNPIDYETECPFFEDSGIDLKEFINRYYEIE